MNPLIPAWIIGGPFIGILMLSFLYKGASAMGGTAVRVPPRVRDDVDLAAPLLDPMHPDAPRRIV